MVKGSDESKGTFEEESSSSCSISFDISVLNTFVFAFSSVEKLLYTFLRENIYNAKEAYNLAKEVCKRVDSIDELAYSLFNKMIELIPSDIDIKELQDAWDKVSKEYKDIVKE